MLATAIALCLVAANPVELRLEESAEIDANEAGAVVRALAFAIEQRTGLTVSVEENTGRSERIGVRVFGGLTLLRVVALRSGAPGQPIQAERDIPSARETWAQPLASLAAALFPEGTWSKVQVRPPPVEEPVLIAPVVPVREQSVGPYVVAGAGLVAGVLGIVFGRNSVSARTEAQDPLRIAEYDRNADRAVSLAVAGNVLMLAGAVGLGTGVTWWLLD